MNRPPPRALGARIIVLPWLEAPTDSWPALSSQRRGRRGGPVMRTPPSTPARARTAVRLLADVRADSECRLAVPRVRK